MNKRQYLIVQSLDVFAITLCVLMCVLAGTRQLTVWLFAFFAWMAVQIAAVLLMIRFKRQTKAQRDAELAAYLASDESLPLAEEIEEHEPEPVLTI